MSSETSRMIDRKRRKGIKSIVLVFLTVLIFSAIATRRINVSSNVGFVSKILEDSETYLTFVVKPECLRTCLESFHSAKNAASLAGEEEVCPEYFQWIHEDLRPWKNTGISREMVERGKAVAHIRLVVVSGRLYVEKYKRAFQTRDLVTVWGILQLLRLYPGKLPDMDLMFECGDKPIVRKEDYDEAAMAPPPVFHYCGDDETYDIVFPDWSFWGWSEINIKPWEIVKMDIKENNDRIKWMDREPYAYWKGNPLLSQVRHDLVGCNSSTNNEWTVRVFDLDWKRERREGFKTTNLTSQCTHRYKIYAEGHAWSVSEKYILACDSMALVINPHYYDFYTRGLLPTVHYWPVQEDQGMCSSINFAVKWGNKHTEKAREIGKAGSDFVQEQLKMTYVYDYMFHVLNQYAKLLKYQPTIPKGAVEVCSETYFCFSKGIRRRFRLASKIDRPSDSSPCSLQHPFDPPTREALLRRKTNLTKQIEQWEESDEISRRKSFV